MRHLMLLRHAKTERDSATSNDRDRRLTARGKTDAPALGDYIAAHDLVPELVLVSPAIRARETFDLVARQWRNAPAHEVVADLYGADASELLRIVRTFVPAVRREAASLMIVGHNPGLHEFALALSRTGEARARRALAENLPTSGLALISAAIDNWAELSFGRGRLERLISPALLREDC